MCFACFADADADEQDGEESESKGENGLDLKGVFGDVALDNHDIQGSPPMQISPIPETPPASMVTMTIDLHRPLMPPCLM